MNKKRNEERPKTFTAVIALLFLALCVLALFWDLGKGRMQLSQQAEPAEETVSYEQQQQENDAESQQPLPVLLHKRLKVYIGTKNIDQDTQQDGDDLDGYLFIIVIVAGSGKNKGHAKAAGQQTQRQQQHIPFF